MKAVGIIRKKAVALLAVGVVVFAGIWAITPVAAESYAQAAKDGPARVSAGTTVDGAVFLFGDHVEVAGAVNGDVYCAGNNVNITGTVEGDVLCAARNIVIAGTVGGGIRAAGSSVVVKGSVKGGAAIAGSSVVLDKGSRIDRDVAVAGEKLSADGSIGRDLKSGVGVATISGSVGRNADISGSKLAVLDGASIGGNLNHAMKKSAAIAEGSVAGTTTKVDRSGSEYGKSGMTLSELAGAALLGLMLLTVLSLFIVLILPRYVTHATNVSLKRYGLAVLAGFVAVIVFLPLMILTVLTGVGIPVALFMLAAGSVVAIVALPLTAYYVGTWVMIGKSTNVFLVMLVGALLLGIGLIIPLLGMFIGLVAFLGGVGLEVFSLRSQFTESSYKAATRVLEKSGVETKKVASKSTTTKRTTKKK